MSRPAWWLWIGCALVLGGFLAWSSFFSALFAVAAVRIGESAHGNALVITLFRWLWLLETAVLGAALATLLRSWRGMPRETWLALAVLPAVAALAGVFLGDGLFAIQAAASLLAIAGAWVFLNRRAS